MNRLFRLQIAILTLASLLMVKSAFNQDIKNAIALQFNYPDSAIGVINDLLPQIKNDSTKLSNAYEVLGISHWVSGRLSESYNWHNKALELRLRLKYGSGIAHSYNNLGLVNWKMGKYQKAIESYHLSLDAAEAVGDLKVKSNVLGNIGVLYKEQGELDQALEFYNQSLAILREGNNYRAIANTLNNIALIFREQGQSERAVSHWKECIQLYKKIEDGRGEALTYNNLGLIFSDENRLQQADSLFAQSLSIYQLLSDSSGLAMVLGNLGTNAKSQGEYIKAIKLCGESYLLAKETGSTDYLISACKCLADAHGLSGNHEKASAFLWRYISLSDSLVSIKDNEQVALIQERYEHEKELMKTAVERERQQASADAEIHRQLVVRNASVIIGVLAMALLIILFINYRKKQRANVLLQSRNAEIFRQRQEIANKSREVTESITYAKRLQDARLPNSELFSKYFSSWHVLFRPKDIVSGDFYWLEFVDGCLYVAVADCTGHGVPGAMVSMVGIQALNEALLNKGLRNPALILDDVNRHMSSSFMKSGNTMSDGMDITLVCIDKQQKKLSFAGAFNPLWIISSQPQIAGATLKLEAEEKYLFELNADRQSIGNNSEEQTFKNQSVAINCDETLVLFSDGFSDQFGGPMNKKFGSRKLKNLVLETATHQNWALVDSAFDSWKGANTQEDDVTFLAVSLK